MIEIFIPIIWICINTKCEFMQAETYFTDEAKCFASLDIHKEHMQNLVKQAGQGTITVMEGTCADAKIKARIEKQTSESKNENSI